MTRKGKKGSAPHYLRAHKVENTSTQHAPISTPDPSIVNGSLRVSKAVLRPSAKDSWDLCMQSSDLSLCLSGAISPVQTFRRDKIDHDAGNQFWGNYRPKCFPRLNISSLCLLVLHPRLQHQQPLTPRPFFVQYTYSLLCLYLFIPFSSSTVFSCPPQSPPVPPLLPVGVSRDSVP